MNFLAHVHLSGGIPELIVGNLVADEYKGKKYLELNQGLVNGVVLHRKIDFFTDTHAEISKAKKWLVPYTGRYSSIALDVILDHFLSRHWQQFNPNSLELDVKNTHDLIMGHKHLVNERSAEFLNILVFNKWLVSYLDLNDLTRIFAQMSRRFGVNELNNSVLGLKENYAELENLFLRFYPEIVSLSNNYINSTAKNHG